MWCICAGAGTASSAPWNGASCRWISSLKCFGWCLAQLPVAPVCLGIQQREVWALDTSTIARLRCGAKLGLAGKGYCHRCQRGVKANIVAVATRVVQVAGVRVGLVRRTRFGQSCEQAIEVLLADLPLGSQKRLYVVDGGGCRDCHGGAVCGQHGARGDLGALAHQLQTALCPAATPRAAGARASAPARGCLASRPCQAPRPCGGCRRVVDAPEVAPVEEFTVAGMAGPVRLRRWHSLHYEETPEVLLDVVRIDDAAYRQPLLVASTAQELTTIEMWHGYGQRWPVETDFFVAQDTAAMEKPRAWQDKAVERRISLH